jgi:hypothetical protein
MQTPLEHLKLAQSGLAMQGKPRAVLHWPVPVHMLLEALIVQLGGSSSYFGTSLHWPIVPGALQVMQVPHELVQQTPSAQKPLWQSLP